jgi:hypothetical protein
VNLRATALAAALVGGACSSSSAGPPPPGWVYVRIDDCTGNNRSTGFTTGTDVPDPANCTHAENGLAAVCWDQLMHSNYALSGPGCIYKTITASACKRGSDPGFLFVCNQP